MAKKRINNTDLIADFTWAELYITNIRENLKIQTQAAKKSSTSLALTEPAALLRQQLEGANRTVAELRKMVRSEPRRFN